MLGWKNATLLLKKLWTDQVGSKVIATIIVAVLATAASIFFDWLPDIRSFGKEAYIFALSSTPLPNWIIAILGFLAAIPIIVLLVIMLRGAFSSSSSTEEWRNYSSDMFFGLRWRWRYFIDGHPDSLCTFCPDCDYQVHGTSYHFAYGNVEVEFRCDSCGKYLTSFKESYAEMEDKVKRFIQQKLRNGTWPRNAIDEKATTNKSHA